MAELTDETITLKNLPKLVSRFTISCFSGVFTQFSLLLIPYLFPTLSLLPHFFFSGAVFVIAIGFCLNIRRLLGIKASAPAFVFFHVIFIWVVYLCVISQAVSLVLTILFNIELTIVLIGFLRILTSDPGFVRDAYPGPVEGSDFEDGHHLEELSSMESGLSFQNSSEVTSLSSRRTRYCKICKAYVVRFDHHCPAFGNCIGQKNYGLFVSLLVGFIITEASYAVLSYQWIDRILILKESHSKIQYSFVVSTMNFCLLQVLWQVVYFAWHVYCMCFNIRTDEWINWRRYPEFHVIVYHSSDQSLSELRFRNPYDEGILCNLKNILFR